MIRRLWLALLALSLTGPAWAGGGPNIVKTVKDDGGWRLMVDGKPTMVFGMNWDYIPIGQNYAWVLWHQPEDVIKEALQGEMALLKAMGVNAIRQYPDIPPKWVEWIYDTYGIYTIVNHTAGRYGFNVNGAWIGNTNYSDEATRAAIKADIAKMVETYKGTRGVLMYLLGNENNYGLTWTSFEAEQLPTGESANGVPLYTLMGELATQIKQRDQNHPIALANGDLGYMGLIAKYGKDIDIMGANVYRGASSRDLFDRVSKELDKPFVYSEFGADAYNARTEKEDANAQAFYLREQWREIYEQSHGKGKSGVAIGGMIFQWSDGWWKHKQVERLDVQDNTATWSTGAYPHDFVEGQFNMNEEWFGIAAKDPGDARGIHTVRPRTAYYLLQAAFKLDPYAQDTTPLKIKQHFETLDPISYEGAYKADKAASLAERNAKVRVSRLELRLGTYFVDSNDGANRPNVVTADSTQSAFFDVTAQPTDKIKGRLSVNVLGNVASNRLNPIFYESRGRASSTISDAPPAPGAPAEQDLSALERVAIYQAEVEIDEPWFRAEGYYRTGRYHWADEGDFFGLYPEAHYGPNLDLYNGRILGAEVHGKKAFDGLKIAFGPEMWWGANAAIIGKYHRKIAGVEFTLMHQEDLGTNPDAVSSVAIPQRRTRKTALSFGYESGGLRIDVGGLMAGTDRLDEEFIWTEDISGRGYRDTGKAVYSDRIQWLDTLGAKARITYKSSQWMAYAHGVVKGLVSDAGVDQRLRFTGWSLNEAGQGNQIGGMAGFAVNWGAFQVAPHVLYQRPLVEPIDDEGDYFSADTGVYYPSLRARNWLDDPFAVINNRETLGLELLLVFDPTPGTWFWQWDNNIREDATFAGALDIVYKHQPTTRDALFGVTAEGVFFPFSGAPSAQDVWDVTFRWVANPAKRLRLVGNVFAGRGQARGTDERVIDRYGADVLALYAPIRFEARVAFDDWGPYDFHKDFNLTFPFQSNFDLSYVIDMQDLTNAMVRVGFQGVVRTLDEFSENFVPDPTDPDATGTEWEIGTYLWMNL